MNTDETRIGMDASCRIRANPRSSAALLPASPLVQFAPPSLPMIRTRLNRQTLPLLASYQEAAMSPAMLGSALGVAAVTVGRGAATAVGNGLSFASELLKAAGSPAAAG